MHELTKATKMKLVKLPDGSWVNPAYVTRVQVDNGLPHTHATVRVVTIPDNSSGLRISTLVYRADFGTLEEAVDHAAYIASVINIADR